MTTTKKAVKKATKKATTTAAKSAASKSVYSTHPGFSREPAFHRNLLERTGKTLDQWAAFVKKSGPPPGKERRAWLKEQGLTTNYADWIAATAEGKEIGADNYDPEALVEAMFSGAKAELLPIYEKLLKLGLSLGKDVTASPGKTMVALYRKRVFARITPTTRTRIDVQLALEESTKPTARLKDIQDKSKNRINRQIGITSAAEIDDEVKRLLKHAYDLESD
jgi:predicted transport protein